MASLGGSALVRHDMPLPLYGNLSRSAFHGAEDDFKKSAHDGYGSGGTAFGSGPTMKTCFWCGYASIRVSDLMTHMKTTHPQEYTANESEMPPGLPPVCGATSPAVAPPGDDGGAAAAVAAARRYKCFSCEARFCRSGTLMDHMRRNHPETRALLPDARPQVPGGSVWSAAIDGGAAASSASTVRFPLAFGGGCSSSEPHSPGGSSEAAASAAAASRKRSSMMQRAESSAADEDEDDDEMDIKVIRLVKQRLAARDGLGRSGEPPLLGKLSSNGWPGRVFRGADVGGGVEQQDLGCLLGALRNAASATSAASGRRASSSGVESAATMSGGEGDSSGGAGGSSGFCVEPVAGAAVGSIHLVRVSGMHASLVAGGKGGRAGGVEVVGGGVPGAGSGLRAPEKYKCFWCDAHFRKRGKLMDHIDLYHKDSKQQTEVQAELLTSNGCGGVAANGVESKQHRSAVGLPEAAVASSSSKVADRRHCQAAAGARLSSPASAAAPGAAAAAAASSTAVVGKSGPACRFVLRSAVLSESEPPAEDTSRPKQQASAPRSCKFYFGKLANPMTFAGAASSGRVIGRAGGLPCGNAAAAAASALSLGLALGSPAAASAAAFGMPYAAMYCVNGDAGNGVRFYQHSHHISANAACCGGACSMSPAAYRLTAGAVLPAASLERLVLPAASGSRDVASGCSALPLHRGLPQQQQQASADAGRGGADLPLDLSSRRR